MPSPPPHAYKDQRLMEKRAATARANELARGDLDLAPICGYTYLPRPTKKQQGDKTWKPSDVVCMRHAGAGTSHTGKGFCDYHEWASEHAVEKATGKRNEMAYALKAAQNRSEFFGERKQIDPTRVLLEEISRSHSIVIFLENKLQYFRDTYGWNDEEILAQTTPKDGAKPSVWFELYKTEREHLVKTCLAAMKAGVHEATIKLAEAQARMIAGMMFAFMHDPALGLTPEQILAAPGLIRKHMMQLPQQNPDAVDPAKVLAQHKGNIVDAVAVDA